MDTPTENEINDVIEQCRDAENEGSSKYPGMSYEQGVIAGILWVQGHEGDPINE